MRERTEYGLLTSVPGIGQVLAATILLETGPINRFTAAGNFASYARYPAAVALIGVALPHFVVTMASQNVPGVAVMRCAGYQTTISPLVGWTGVATLLLAPLGAFALNLAAITAAICMGCEAHEDPQKRYVAAVAAGVFYLLIGIFGATVGSLFAALPSELILAIAGLALLGSIGNGLATALADETQREPALLTFLVTASGVVFCGIGSAFWGLVGGLVVLLMQLATRSQTAVLCRLLGQKRRK